MAFRFIRLVFLSHLPFNFINFINRKQLILLERGGKDTDLVHSLQHTRIQQTALNGRKSQKGKNPTDSPKRPKKSKR